MKGSRSLITTFALIAALPSCKDGDRDRFGDSPSFPAGSGGRQVDLPGSSLGGSGGRASRAGGAGGAADEPAPPPDAAAPHDEIDNTIYWDAATKPTSDHVRGIDAGTPDR